MMIASHVKLLFSVNTACQCDKPVSMKHIPMIGIWHSSHRSPMKSVEIDNQNMLSAQNISES